MLELVIYDIKNKKMFTLIYTDYYTECEKVKKRLNKMRFSDNVCLVDYSCSDEWYYDKKIRWLLDKTITILTKEN